MLYGSVDSVVADDLDADSVGYIQTAGFAQVLQSVDEFAGYTFLNQFGRQFDVERDGQHAVVHHEPAGHIFGQDFYIFLNELIVDS